MSRYLETIQQERATRSHIAPILMAKVTLYTDRNSGTVDETWYFSNVAMTNYDYDATGEYKKFWPVIVGGSDIVSEIQHIGRPNAEAPFRQTFDLLISNVEIDGSTMAVHFLAHNYLNARIEVSQLLVDEIDGHPLTLPSIERRSRKAGITYEDSFDGDEHTVLFRGRIARMGPINEDHLRLQCETDLPSMADSWIYAEDATITDPRDLGKRLPRIYGAAKHVPLLNYQVGWVTTLTEPLDSTETGTGYKIGDGTGFPASSFTARIDGEEMTLSSAAATTVTISSRGTPASAHEAGALIAEIPTTSKFIVSDREVNAINQLYCINPINGVLQRLDSSATPWTTTLADTTTISGETITTVSFSASQMSDLIDYFNTQAAPAGAITTQPEFTNPTTELRFPMTAFVPTTIATNAALPYASSIYAQFSDYVAISNGWRMDLSSTSGDQDGLWFWLPSGLITDSGRSVYRFRFVAVVDYDSDSGAAMQFYYNWDFAGASQDTLISVSAAASDVDGTTYVSDWDYPSSATVADFERSTTPTASNLNETVAVYLRPSGSPNGDGSVTIKSLELVIELNDEDLTRNTDAVSSTGIGSGYGLQFYADVDGIEAAQLDPVFEVVEDFESGTWGALNCTAALTATKYHSGTKSLMLTWDADAQAGSEEFTTESTTGWHGYYCTLDTPNDEGHRLGSYALELSANSTTNDAIAEWRTDGWSTLEGFESGTWNALNCSAAVSATNPYSGTNSLAITFDPDTEGTQLAQSDTTTGWYNYYEGSRVSFSVETGTYTQGSGCIKTTILSNIGYGYYARTPIFSALDVTSASATDAGRKKFAVDVLMHPSGRDFFPYDINFYMINSTTTIDRHWSIPASDFTADTWYTVIFGEDDYSYNDSGFDPTAVRYLQVAVQNAQIGEHFLVDNVRWIREDSVAQNNVIGGGDFTSSSDDYFVRYYAGGAQRIDDETQPTSNCDLWISSATWSGTTVGTDYWMMPMDPADVRGAWQEINHTGSFTTGGSFTKTNVNSMRIAVRNVSGVYPAETAIVHYFDDFSGNTPLTAPSVQIWDYSYDRGAYMLMLDFKIKKAGTTGDIEIRLGTDFENYYYTPAGEINVSDFAENTWATILLNYQDMNSLGSPDTSDINYIAVVFNRATRSASCQVYLDNIKFVGQNSVAQNNAIGAVDFTSDEGYYRIRYYFDADNYTDRRVKAWFTDDTWSGTTRGATDYISADFEHPAYPDNWLSDSDWDYWDTGSPDVTQIRTLRLQVQNSPGIYDRDPTNVHYLDSFQLNNPDSLYSVASGACLKHPSDIIAHWITEEGGETVDTTSLSTVISAIGAGAEWGFDARSLGYSWEEILHRMAFEARCNVVPIETETGRKWTLLCADDSYGFGAAAGTITQTHSMSDLGRDLIDCASHFTFRYGFDASLPGGGNEEGFRYALLAEPGNSDVYLASSVMTNSAARIGNLQADPVAFRCIQQVGLAKEVAGFYVQEMCDEDRRVLELREVAWFEALLWNVGDIVSIAPPWMAGAVTCRIVSMRQSFGAHTWTITAVEVLASGYHT